MVKKSLYLIVLFFMLSCQKEKEFAIPGLAKVELLSYPDRIMWDTIGKGPELFDKDLKTKSKLNFDSTMIKERLVLKPNQMKELSMLLQETCGEEEAVAACYMPRHMILFRDNKNRIIGYKEFCFTCVGSRSSENMMKYDSFCMSDMAKLFEKFGIKYFGDTLEQEREESNLFDSLQKARNIKNKKILK